MSRVIPTWSHTRPMGVKTTRDLVGPRAGVFVRMVQPRALPRAEAELWITFPLFILQGVGTRSWGSGFLSLSFAREALRDGDTVFS